MPTYDYECEACHVVSEIIHGMREKLDPRESCPACGGHRLVKQVTCCRVKVPDSGWEYENGGRGRFIGQLAKHSPCGNGYDEKDPNAYCRSQREAITKAKDQGKKVERII